MACIERQRLLSKVVDVSSKKIVAKISKLEEKITDAKKIDLIVNFVTNQIAEFRIAEILRF